MGAKAVARRRAAAAHSCRLGVDERVVVLAASTSVAGAWLMRRFRLAHDTEGAAEKGGLRA